MAKNWQKFELKMCHISICFTFKFFMFCTLG